MMGGGGGGGVQYFSIWQPRPLVEIYITGSIPIVNIIYQLQTRPPSAELQS